MAEKIPLGAILIGGGVAGAIYYFTRGEGTKPSPNLNPFQNLREAANQRSDQSVDLASIKLDSTVINVVRPAPYAIVGCGKRWAMPMPLVRGSRVGGGDVYSQAADRAGYSGVDSFWPPAFVRGCRPPSSGRPWFIPVYRADRDLDRAGAGFGGASSPVPPVEYVEGTPGVARFPASGQERATVPGFVVDDVAWIRSTATRNFQVVGAKRKGRPDVLRLYLSNAGWTAWDGLGRNIPADQVELTYRGTVVPADVNPFAVAPWTGDQAPGNGKIFASSNPELPWDLIGPPWIAAVLQLGHRPMKNVRI